MMYVGEVAFEVQMYRNEELVEERWFTWEA